MKALYETCICRSVKGSLYSPRSVSFSFALRIMEVFSDNSAAKGHPGWAVWRHSTQQHGLHNTLVFLAIEAAVPCWDGAHMWLCTFYLQNTLEQCSVCAKPIMERILRATGKAYHPHCFTCVMCHRSLDGIPFTVDAGGNIHCIEDFHKYVPSCSQWLCLSFSFVPKNPPFLFAECPKSSGPSAAYSEDS